MGDRRRLLTLTAAYAVVAAALVWLVAPGGGAGVLLVPLVLVCPGYALSQVFRMSDNRDNLEVAVLTVTLSFATSALGGLLLQALGVPLTARSWSTALAVVTLVAAVWPWLRQENSRPPQRLHAGRLRMGAAFATATIVLLVVAAALAVESAQNLDARQSPTQLAVDPVGTDRSEVRVTVTNTEAAPRRFRLEIAADGRTITVPLALAAGERWSTSWSNVRGARSPASVKLLAANGSGRELRTVWLGRRLR